MVLRYFTSTQRINIVQSDSIRDIQVTQVRTSHTFKVNLLLYKLSQTYKM